MSRRMSAIVAVVAEAALCGAAAMMAVVVALVFVPAAMDLLARDRSLFAFVVFVVALFLLARWRLRVREDG